MNKSVFYGSVLAAFILGGCAIGPDYAKPDISVPAAFNNANGTHTVKQEWWKTFNDPVLDAAVTEALEHNYDLAASRASVDVMLAQFDQTKSYLYPQINAGGSITRKRTDNAAASAPSNLQDGVTTTYASSLSMASYEIDLFGKVRRANEAARAYLLSSEYTKDSFRLSLIANVSASYFRLSSIQEQIVLARENVKLTQEIYDITRLKYQTGTIAETPMLQSESEVQSAKATLSSLEAAQSSEEAVFNTLLGRNPERVSTTSIDSITLPAVPEALPSTVLEQRPDIASSEQDLIAANAKIGVAKAAYFPSITLTGSLGIQSLDLSKFVSNPTQIWQMAPAVNIPIFTAGRIASDVKIAEANQNIALIQYKKTIVNAFNDTDSALSSNTKALEQLEYQKIRSKAIAKALEQAKLSYKVGTIAYPDLLQVQQQWLSARQNLIIARQNALNAVVNVNKMLGGGWKTDPATEPKTDYFPSGR